MNIVDESLLKYDKESIIYAFLCEIALNKSKACVDSLSRAVIFAAIFQPLAGETSLNALDIFEGLSKGLENRHNCGETDHRNFEYYMNDLGNLHRYLGIAAEESKSISKRVEVARRHNMAVQPIITKIWRRIANININRDFSQLRFPTF